MAKLVLVTGGSGFIGGHCVQAALDAGYDVRTTARSTSGAEALKARFSAPERAATRLRQASPEVGLNAPAS